MGKLRRATLYHNLKYIDDGKDKAERIARLHELSCIDLKMFLDYCFNPNIKWLVKDNPSYTPSNDEPSSLYYNLVRQLKRMQVFLNFGPYPNMEEKRRLFLFVQFLESLDPKDAELVIDVKAGRMPFKNVTKALVQEAFPKFTKTWVEPKPKPPAKAT
jgi:hypothetical protein